MGFLFHFCNTKEQDKASQPWDKEGKYNHNVSQTATTQNTELLFHHLAFLKLVHS